jgi:HTH-type transcriptional regulator/antitoxin HigA
MDEFAPDWISPPGDTIWDLLTERNISLSAFQAQTGFDFSYLHGLLTGTAAITPVAAWRLSVVLGSTSEFWLARQRNYERLSL